MSTLAPVVGATDVMVAQNVAFAVIAAAMVFSAVRVVTTKNVVHAALHLVVVLGGVAAQYVLLAAEFVAVTQVLVYIGAIVVLFLFGIMLTQAKLGRTDDLDNKPMRPYALGVAGALALLLGYALWDGFRDTELPLADATTGGLNQTTGQVSDTIFGTYLVPFEAISVLLLAALIGAIVLARRD
jgi:NADH-quinone oxidoreductase subunit J